MALVVIVMAASFGSSFFTKQEEKKKHRRETGFLVAILTTFVFIPSASLVVFQCFVCDPVTNTLHADALVTCDSSDDDYVKIRLVGTIGIFLWPIGVPLTYLFLLWKHFGPGWSKFRSQVYSFFAGHSLLDSQSAASARDKKIAIQHVNWVIAEEIMDEHEEQMRLFKLEQSAPKYLHALNGEFEPQVSL